LEALQPFTNAYGWSISLTEAAISVGPLYYFEGEPILAHRSIQRPQPNHNRWFFIPEAHAHPGHYQSGEALGQVLEPTSFDLLGGEMELPGGEGVTGIVRSARFSFGSPIVGPAALLLGENLVTVSGVATKEDRTIEFFAGANEQDILDRNGDLEVEGCTFDAIHIDGDGRVTLRFDPRFWIDQVDFSLLGDESPAQLVRGEPVHRAFVRGVVKAAVYHFSYEAVQ
jgi:hypothetical protein